MWMCTDFSIGRSCQFRGSRQHQTSSGADVTEYTLLEFTCRAFLGWLHSVRGIPLEDLSLVMAIPSAERNGVMTAFDYVQWLTDERQIRLSLIKNATELQQTFQQLSCRKRVDFLEHDSVDCNAHSVLTEGLVVRSIMAGAKFLYHSQSKVSHSSGTPSSVTPPH